MHRLSRLILLFSVAFTLFFVGPVLLNNQFVPYSLLKMGEIFDLLTPLVLIPLYWLLYQIDQDKAPGLSESVIFLHLGFLHEVLQQNPISLYCLWAAQN